MRSSRRVTIKATRVRLICRQPLPTGERCYHSESSRTPRQARWRTQWRQRRSTDRPHNRDAHNRRARNAIDYGHRRTAVIPPRKCISGAQARNDGHCSQSRNDSHHNFHDDTPYNDVYSSEPCRVRKHPSHVISHCRIRSADAHRR